jgi:hypothetical protein
MRVWGSRSRLFVLSSQARHPGALRLDCLPRWLLLVRWWAGRLGTDLRSSCAASEGEQRSTVEKRLLQRASVPAGGGLVADATACSRMRGPCYDACKGEN